MEINIKQPSASLYDEVAEEFAESFDKPQASQLRRFYDEIVYFEELAKQELYSVKDKQTSNATTVINPSNWDEILPLIKMMNAKAAYALGRKHIDPSFYEVFKKLIKQVDNIKELQNLKLFLEATIGFRKLRENNDLKK